MTRPPEADPPPFVAFDGGRLEDVTPLGRRINRELLEATGRPELRGRFDTTSILRRRPRLDDRSTTSPHGDPLRSSMPRRSPLAKVAAAIRAADASALGLGGLGLSPLLGLSPFLGPPPIQVTDERHYWDGSRRTMLAELRGSFGPRLGFDLVTSPLIPDGHMALIGRRLLLPDHDDVGRPFAITRTPGYSRYTLGGREAAAAVRRRRR